MSARLVRHKLIIAYEGTRFRGWQSQTGGNTVQDLLSGAVSAVTGAKATVHGAGRTDAGVHAEGQVAHIDVVNGRIAPEKWPLALNAHLPAEIRVMECVIVPPDFHARFSATGKIYTYRIWNDRVHSPFELNRSWQVPLTLDADAMDSAARLLIGIHDFRNFAANRGIPVENTVREIRRIVVTQSGPLISMEFEGNGFLYKMVRLLCGTLVRVGQGRADETFIRRLLDPGSGVKTPYCAPAAGLYLTRVLY